MVGAIHSKNFPKYFDPRTVTVVKDDLCWRSNGGIPFTVNLRGVDLFFRKKW